LFLQVEQLQSLEKEIASLREDLLVAQREREEKKQSRSREALPPAVEKELVDLKYEKTLLLVLIRMVEV